MNLLYNAGIAAFSGALSLVSLRSPKIREMLRGQRATLDELRTARLKIAPQGFDVWFHAASLGEFEQGRPLIERLRRERPGIRILLTFFSPSGYKVRHNYEAVDAVFYLPLDTPGRVRAFLDAARPRMAVFIKYEFWGNYLAELKRRGIPAFIVSAIFRPGQRFFRPGGGMFRKVLRCFNHIFVQDANSQALLGSVGIDNVTVAGDTRFDRVTDIMRDARRLPDAIGRFVEGSPFTLVAGSSWEPDEDVYIPWLAANPEARAIIAPHEFDARRLERLCNRLGPGACLLSELEAGNPVPEGCRAVIVDSFGLLSSLYRVASVAYIGGGFGAGIHNINEAAVYSVPVVFGPNNKKFKEAADLVGASGGFEVHGPADAAAVLDRLSGDKAFRESAGKAAGDYIARSVGASDIIYNSIFKNI